MKSPVFKGTSWASSSSGKPCSEMRCYAAAGWCGFQWPVLSVAPLPLWACPEGGLRMSQHCCELCQPPALRDYCQLDNLLTDVNPLCPSSLLFQGRADLCQHLSSPQSVGHMPHMISILDTASLWVLPEAWTDEKLTSWLAQPRVRRWCTKHWHWQYLTSPSSCPCLLLLTYQTAAQGDAPEVIALQEVAENRHLGQRWSAASEFHLP